MNDVDLQFELYLVYSIVGGNSEDSGEVQFQEEIFPVIHRSDAHVGEAG